MMKKQSKLRWIADFIREKLNASTGFEFTILLQGDKPLDGSIYLTTINSNRGIRNRRI